MVLSAELEAAIERARRSSAQQAASGAPMVPLVVRRSLRDRLETDLGLFGAEVDDLMRRELAGPIVVAELQPGRYILTCPSLSIRASADDAGSALIAHGIVALDADTLDRDRERGWAASLRFELGRSPDSEVGAQAVRELAQAVAEDAQRRRSERADERARPFVVWRGLLAHLRAHEAVAEQPRRHTSVSRTARGVRFRMAAPAERELVGEAVVAEAQGGS